MEPPYPHMVFKEEFEGIFLDYFTKKAFIRWLQILTGYRGLTSKGQKKKITVLICERKENFELQHVRKKEYILNMHLPKGAIIIFDVSFLHALTYSPQVHIENYYQKIEPVEERI